MASISVASRGRPGSAAAGGVDDLGDEDLARRGDRGELQLLLGAEVGEQPALAHVQLGREPADRQPFEAFDGGEVDRGREDRLARAPSALAAAVETAARGLSRVLAIGHGRK